MGSLDLHEYLTTNRLIMLNTLNPLSPRPLPSKFGLTSWVQSCVGKTDPQITFFNLKNSSNGYWQIKNPSINSRRNTLLKEHHSKFGSNWSSGVREEFWIFVNNIDRWHSHGVWVRWAYKWIQFSRWHVLCFLIQNWCLKNF